MQDASGDVDHWVPVFGASFEKDDLGAVGGEAVGECAASRTSADDDVIAIWTAGFSGLFRHRVAH